MYNTLFSIFCQGCVIRDIEDKKVGLPTGSFSFHRGAFYSYKLKIAEFEGFTLKIYPVSKKLGGSYVSNTTSKHIHQILDLCRLYHIDYKIVDIDEYNNLNLE